jgi:hypothetical protein
VSITKRGHDEVTRVHSVGRVLPDKPTVDQRVSDAELISLVSKAQAEIEAHGEVSEPDLLLRDFAWELLKKPCG